MKIEPWGGDSFEFDRAREGQFGLRYLMHTQVTGEAETTPERF